MVFIFLVLGVVALILSVYIFIRTFQLNGKGKKIQVKVISQEPMTKKIKNAIENEQNEIIAQNPNVLNDWDEEYGDRVVKLVFIGKDLDKHEITKLLNECE